MSRRTGQNGNVYQHKESKNWYGRYWIDTPAGRKQKTITIGLCPTKSIARQRLREYLEKMGLNARQNFTENTTAAVTFKQQAEMWIEDMRTRARKPAKPATLSSWRYALDGWLLPNLGDLPLSDVNNKAARELVGKMIAPGLSANTIRIHFNVIRMVVASAVDENGEPIHPRKWNHNFINLPIVQNERRPTITEVDLRTILTNAKGQYRVLFALLPGTGLRIGEALGLRAQDFGPDCRVLNIQQSVWERQPQAPKTLNAIRTIDLPEPLARMVREHISKPGYLFATRNGNPLSHRNVRRALKRAAGRTIGFHAFRRFRAAVLRKAQVPEDLIKLWLGHAGNLTDEYARQLREDVAFRQDWAARVGLGFVCDNVIKRVEDAA